MKKFILFYLSFSTIFGQGIKYPREVKFENIKLSQPKTYTQWLHYEKSNSEHITCEIKNYYENGLSLTLQLSNYFDKNKKVINSAIRIFKGRKQIAFENNLPELVFLPPNPKLEIFDFDNNGINDIKFSLYLGGNTGLMNIGKIYYLYGFKKYFDLYSFQIRDPDYSWEADLDNNGEYEILIGHHGDKSLPGYADKKTGKWHSQIFRKYLYINVYKFENGKIRLSKLTKNFPYILVFDGQYTFTGKDVFDIYHDTSFTNINEAVIPDNFYYHRFNLTY